jgi:hypothetical protein
LNKPNTFPKAVTFKSPIAFPHRAKTSATLVIDAVSYQREALFFPAEPLEKNRLFFWYFSFGEAKEKYDNTNR